MEFYYLEESRSFAILEEEEEDIGSMSTSGSSDDPSELDDDAASSSAFAMASLIQQLPIRRGLSKHFDGKSQSFASLEAVRSVADLVKPSRKPMRSSRSCSRLSPKRSASAFAKKSTRTASGKMSPNALGMIFA